MSSADAPGICATCLPLSISFIPAQPCENLRGGVQETPAQTMLPNPYPEWPASSVVCPVGAKINRGLAWEREECTGCRRKWMRKDDQAQSTSSLLRLKCLTLNQNTFGKQLRAFKRDVSIIPPRKVKLPNVSSNGEAWRISKQVT